MRWRALAYLGKLENNTKETYGFNSRKCPPSVEELTSFENDMMLMIKNIEFKQVRNDFQTTLKSDIEEINQSTKVLITADKSRNIYKLDKDQYDKLLSENVTKTYKKCHKNKSTKINQETKKIAKELHIDDRMEKMQESEAYITIKDHKEGFPNRVSCRLINPSKSDIGRISKSILDKINDKIIQATNLNQWKNTYSVIDWFNLIKQKEQCSFIIFDIENFYPSITPKLFNDSISYARSMVEISQKDLNVILQARKTLLFHKTEPWVKKQGDEDFDVPMGCYDGAEVCQLVGTFILSKLAAIIEKESMGLYRDDGLAVLRNLSGPETDRKRKNIINIFKQCGLSITIQTNIKIADFLDVQFNLTNNSHKPYRKPNNEPIYINKLSNHPPNILKELSKSIHKRISEISSNEAIFNQSIGKYKSALKASGFDEKGDYTPKITNNIPGIEKQNRKRNITWFNPPFSINVKTNIGRTFFKLLQKHFPRTNKLHKIFNKNTVKLSYSCMNNMSAVISSHNKSILSPNINVFGCNCRVKCDCPLQNKCLTTQIVYQAEVTNDNDDESKIYIGHTSTSFKERYRNHTKSFRHKQYHTDTELSKYVWELKDKNITPKITWGILKRINGIPKVNFCKLCLSEKHFIIKSLDNANLLNKKSEFIAKCRHQNKTMINSVKSDSQD